jgi:hypothetical protein
MTRALAYLHARLQEPGTMRSLVVVIVGIQQGASAASLTDHLVALALVGLGAVSALKPESK